MAGEMDQETLDTAVDEIAAGLFGPKESGDNNGKSEGGAADTSGDKGTGAEDKKPENKVTKEGDTGKKESAEGGKEEELAGKSKVADDKGTKAPTTKPDGTDIGDATKEKTGLEGPTAPKTWRPDAAKDWESLPANVKAEVLKREEDMFKGIEGYKKEAELGRSIRDVVQPHYEQLRREGVEPLYLIKNLLNAHMILGHSADDQQKLAIFQKLAESYNVELDPVKRAYQDPEIIGLKKTIANLESRLNTTENRSTEVNQTTLRQEIDAFATDPNNRYFDQLTEDVAALLRSGIAKDLRDAYDRAVYANPTTRALEIQRLATEANEKAKKEEEEKAAAAKEAMAANLKTTTQVASVTTPLGSMDDTLNQTLAAIKARQS